MSDHRPDLYGHVEGSWRTAPPPDDLVEQALAYECPDCNVNVFVDEDAAVDGEYRLTVAHDETCPQMVGHEP